MSDLKTSSAGSSSHGERNSNALAILKLGEIASDLLANADNPDFVRGKAEELMTISEQAFDILEFIGSNFSELEQQMSQSA